MRSRSAAEVRPVIADQTWFSNDRPEVRESSSPPTEPTDTTPRITPRMKRTLRERSGGSSASATGISRQRQARHAAESATNPSRIPTSQAVIPRSMKEWTEKSARMPERVRKVP
jgi:hypothetical protein